MTSPPSLDTINFWTWQGIKSAWWWLGILYRKPALFESATRGLGGLQSAWFTARLGLAFFLSTLPLITFIRIFLFFLLRDTGATLRFEYLIYQITEISKKILFGIFLGFSFGVPGSFVGGILGGINGGINDDIFSIYFSIFAFGAAAGAATCIRRRNSKSFIFNSLKFIIAMVFIAIVLVIYLLYNEPPDTYSGEFKINAFKLLGYFLVFFLLFCLFFFI